MGTRFPRALTGQAGALGPPAWAKGPAEPWDKGGPKCEVSEELTSGSRAHHVRAQPGYVCGCRTETGRKKAWETLVFPQAFFKCGSHNRLTLILSAE